PVAPPRLGHRRPHRRTSAPAAHRSGRRLRMTSSDPVGLPSRMAAMLAGTGPLPPDSSDWVFEIKWDGARLLLQTAGSLVLARTRTGRDATQAFPELAEAARLLDGRRAVLDGELVAFAAAGTRPSFQLLQQRLPVAAPGPVLLAATPVRYLVFDVLYLDDGPTIDLPYHE